MSQGTPLNRFPAWGLSFFRGAVNVTAGGALVLGLIMLLGVWRAGDQFWRGFTDLFTGPPAEPEVDVRSVVVQQIRGASELTTAIFAMEAVVPAQQERLLGQFSIGTTKLLFLAYGEVSAGVDLSQLQPQDVTVREDSLEITLPPPQILDGKIDVQRSTVYDYDRGFLGLGPDTAPQLQTLASQAALDKIVAAACSESILEEANRRADLAVTQLLSTVSEKRIVVDVQAPDTATCTLPAAAQAAAPVTAAPTVE